MEDYLVLSDTELVVLAKNNDERAFEAIVSRYNEFIYFKARTYFINGWDDEDLYQEGVLALYQAVMRYDPSKKASFNTFAMLCINNKLRNDVKNSLRKGRDKASKNISYELIRDEERGLKASEMPEKYVVSKDMARELLDGIRTVLTDKECRVMISRINGDNYKTIAEKESTNVKSISNAMDRARKKINVRYNKDEYYSDCTITIDILEELLNK